MDIAVVTGASSSLGQAISRLLLDLGFRIYGLGGDYSNCDLKNANFIPVRCDLSNPQAVDAEARKILEKEKGVYVVIHNAKFYPQDNFLKTHGEILERSLKINLLCPLVLTQVFSKSLSELQGFVFQLGPASSEMSRGGVIGATAAGGLKWMGEALFDELRNYGVKVCHIAPEPNARLLASKGNAADQRKETIIDPLAVAAAISQVISNPTGNLISEMVIRPQRTEANGSPLVRTIPHPQPQPIPYTVPKEFIEAEEYLEEEALKKKEASQKQKNRKPQKPKGKKRSETAQNSNEENKISDQNLEDNKKQQSLSHNKKSKGRKPKPGGSTRSEISPSSNESFNTNSENASNSNSLKQKDPRNRRNKSAEQRQLRKSVQNTEAKDKAKEGDKPVKPTAKKSPRKKPAKKQAKQNNKSAKKKTATKKVAAKKSAARTPKKKTAKKKPAKKSAKKNPKQES